ncbi:MAG TPA: class E sortase [Baekduia sp.]|nr:class E sortase [Baekduia sp.]
MLVAGLVASLAVVADGLLTIAWQEPVTAALQSRAQAGLRDDLSHLEHSFAAHDARLIAAQRRQRQAARAARLERDAVAMLHAQPDGAAIGRIEIPQIDLDAVVVESTGHDALARGPGHYRGTALPGMPGTVGIAGHRTTYGAPFRHLDALRPGSRITVQMPYGRFAYRVTGTKITTPDDASSLRAKAGAPRLVLTACHPLYSAAQRIVVTARQVAPVPR